VEAEPGARRSGRHGNRSGSRRRFGNTQRTVPAGVAMGHSLLLALSASMVVIGAAGVLEWRDDDFLNLVIGASFLKGMQVMYQVQKYLRGRKKQRDRQALKAEGEARAVPRMPVVTISCGLGLKPVRSGHNPAPYRGLASSLVECSLAITVAAADSQITPTHVSDSLAPTRSR